VVPARCGCTAWRSGWKSSSSTRGRGFALNQQQRGALSPPPPAPLPPQPPIPVQVPPQTSIPAQAPPQVHQTPDLAQQSPLQPHQAPEAAGCQGNIESYQAPLVGDVGKAVELDKCAKVNEEAPIKGDGHEFGSSDAAWEQAVQQDSASSGQGAKNAFAGVCFRCNEHGHYAYACKVGAGGPKFQVRKFSGRKWSGPE
jgi:hypothetical protein